MQSAKRTSRGSSGGFQPAGRAAAAERVSVDDQRRYGVKLRFLFATTSVVLASCSRGDTGRSAETERTDGRTNLVEQPSADCSAAEGDSARAVCLATRLEFPDPAPRTVFEVARRGDTICVTTGPGQQPDGTVMVDGMARIKVLKGAVVERVESDSIGCGERR